MNFFERLQKIDRRILYILMAIAVTYALIKPMGLPIKISAATQKSYDVINALPEGSTVVYMFDYDPSGAPELHPNALAMGKLLFEKHAKVICATMWANGTGMINLFLQQMTTDFPNLVEGTDYVNLGYKPGGQVWAEAATVDFVSACAGVDVSGKPIASMPIFQNFKVSKDAALWIDLAAGNPGIEELIKTVGRFGTPIIGACTAVSVTTNMPFLSANQIVGLQMGMRGAAEMELLVNRPGTAISGMDAQSLAHAMLVLFILVGNIGYLASRTKSDDKR